MLKKISLSSFFLGVATTLIFSLVAITAIGFFYINRGVSITVGVSDVGPMVKEQVKEILESQLPIYVEELKSEIPFIIDNEMTGTITHATIKIGDMEFALPSDTIKVFEDNFKEQVSNAMNKLLDGLDEEMIAENVSKDVEDMVNVFLEENINNKVFFVSPLKRLNLPVTITVSYEEDTVVPVINPVEN